jgi:hypothetical protein
MNFFHKRNYVCHAIIIHADVDKQGFVIKMKNDYIYSRSFVLYTLLPSALNM